VEPSDRQIVEEVLAGDRERFELLVERHGRPLLAWLRASGSRPDEARELFQEAWVRAWSELGRLRDPGRFRAWLFAIAHHALCHEKRRPGPRALSGAALADPERAVSAADPASDPAAGPGAQLERSELLARVRAEVDRLPERQRAVFQLRVAGELSHVAIGSVLGISAENARAHLHQALARLRERLADLKEDHDGGLP